MYPYVRRAGSNFVTDGTTGKYNTISPVSTSTDDLLNIELDYNADAHELTEYVTDTVTGQTYTHDYTGINIQQALGEAARPTSASRAPRVNLRPIHQEFQFVPTADNSILVAPPTPLRTYPQASAPLRISATPFP